MIVGQRSVWGAAAWLWAACLSPAGAADHLNLSGCPATTPAPDNSARLEPFYPAPAKAAGREGEATINCGRSEFGRLINCSISSETPEGFGFGEAALKLVATMPDNLRGRWAPRAATFLQPSTFRFTFSKPYIVPDVLSDRFGAPSVITLPDWLEKPTAEQLMGAYPRRLLSSNPPGRVTLGCDVSNSGQATSCKVLEEDPLGRGFGEAALRLSKQFRFRPMTRDGLPCDGGYVKVPLTFSLP